MKVQYNKVSSILKYFMVNRMELHVWGCLIWRMFLHTNSSAPTSPFLKIIQIETRWNENIFNTISPDVVAFNRTTSDKNPPVFHATNLPFCFSTQFLGPCLGHCIQLFFKAQLQHLVRLRKKRQRPLLAVELGLIQDQEGHGVQGQGIQAQQI